MNSHQNIITDETNVLTASNRNTFLQMQGFIPTAASRPPQSVASMNFTNLEDSESMIRAYKKKKVELEDIKEQFYKIETEYFTEKQKAHLLDEELQ